MILSMSLRIYVCMYVCMIEMKRNISTDVFTCYGEPQDFPTG